MKVDQFHWSKKMVNMEVDGAEESPCCQLRRATLEDMSSPEIDFLSQTNKYLSKTSPFDAPGEGSAFELSKTTLPIVLANLANRTDNKKRSKKPQKLPTESIWIENKNYFRCLELSDLETLSDLVSLRSLSSRNCFSVPSLEHKSFNIQQKESMNASAKNDGIRQPVGVNNVEKEISTESGYSGDIEWVLGCRDRFLLGLDRLSRKMSLGFRKLMVAAICEAGNSLLCDFCCTGETKEYHHHQLIVCTSCKATVHKKCYGVVEDTDESWLCSWCELDNGCCDSERPCLLCPKKGGILKPVDSISKSGGPVEFAHLFCSLWRPEVYIEDLEKMQPILNFPGIKETRRKLLCSLCKVKSGACIKCCIGTCQTAFHPRCAREAGNRLEVWGKHGCDTVELLAMCSKHSDIQESRRSIEGQGGENNAVDSCHLPSESVRESHLSNDENYKSPSSMILDHLDLEAYPGFNPHPYIQKELSEMGKGLSLKSRTHSNEQSQRADCRDTLAILDLSPEDEVEGELLYYQLQLLGIAVSRKQLSENLVYEVAKKLPQDIDEQHGRRWDDALVNKFFHDVNEARKKSRKDRRHKIAFDALATATATATCSRSRITSLRKDMSEEPAQQKMSTSRCKVAGSSSVENPQTCDICSLSVTKPNQILVCSSCKVSVHMDCYKRAKEPSGPWYCELCAESYSGASSTKCALCGGTNGAFRKATNGQWVHAFCAEWSLDSTYRRGQINPVNGMESLVKNTDNCSVCQQIHGSCIKCSYGDCQTTFHASCAKSGGFHMSRSQQLARMAYCEKHSLENKEKTRGEELKKLKHIRGELEKLRLLCERIVKREKVKRQLTVCSHEILAARSLNLVDRFLRPEAIQRSDDITIDNTVFLTRRGPGIGKGPISENGDKSSKLKKKELVIASDELSSENQRLPKPGNRKAPSSD